jgi:hypothetical protein
VEEDGIEERDAKDEDEEETWRLETECHELMPTTSSHVCDT